MLKSLFFPMANCFLKPFAYRFTSFSGTFSMPSKHKDIVTMSVGNVVTTLQNDFLSMLWQPTAKAVTVLQSHRFIKYFKTSLQCCIIFASANNFRILRRATIDHEITLKIL